MAQRTRNYQTLRSHLLSSKIELSINISPLTLFDASLLPHPTDRSN
ncbi:hypothetical protein [Nostoc sp. GT001]|nr:hypothetical protein [Nostoc sp. GT001]MDM9580581.1 hypothetical protein [Nostoc sp. GT001]MDZ7945921.1 hypothetical protein [Nostoc sp. EfeVER01]